MIPFYENKFGAIFAAHSTSLIFPAHLHNAMECIYVVSGEIEITIENISYHLKRGEMAVVFPNVVHSYYSNESEENCYELFIYPNQAKSKIYGIVQDKKPIYPILLSTQIHHDIPNQIHEIIDLYRCEKPNHLLMDTLAQLVLIRTLDELELIKQNATSENIIGGAVMYIAENFKSSISLEKIAKYLGISKYYLSRMLKDALGMGVCTYINNLRIDYAKALLTTTSLTVSEVAMESGYDSLRSFNRCFKKITSVSPKEYRNKS
ncbi:AraC family transcriptional regulator [Paludicola sp. MB14-C6]|uniref:helix-turn-helix transcriptional regulator n=1 Tax=Paludihabitans sp. MB14-C6 TaxID=3070656 RepID=UPI0027DDA87F|nr:AraC family transcriptional regulator [Paludicola sp. MB14-C6]WMJ22843.1 AraC family transcriptional regulator [Paludicola sp. MB14-C6]